MEADVVALAHHSLLWRVHDAAGPHPRAWHTLRLVGPISSCRFDPHEPPLREQTEGVLYTALDMATAIAERFQAQRLIDRERSAPHIVGFHPLRTLRLLDLTDTWPIRAGASHVINTGRRDVTRLWARAIRVAYPDLDGLWHTSSMTGRPCVTLWNPAADAIPRRAVLDRPLADDAVLPWLAEISEQIGYGLI